MNDVREMHHLNTPYVVLAYTWCGLFNINLEVISNHLWIVFLDYL